MNVVSVVKKRKWVEKIITEMSVIVQLNYWFYVLFIYSKLKRFCQFSQVKQCTDVEQKIIIHQLISVITSLLITQTLTAMHCAQTIIDFIILTQYQSHNDETLWYMSQTLYQVNKLKEVFWEFQSVNKKTNKGHFNFLKFHVITHYIDFIYQYNSANRFNISHSEVTHKYLVKTFYKQINKRDDF